MGKIIEKTKDLCMFLLMGILGVLGFVASCIVIPLLLLMFFALALPVSIVCALVGIVFVVREDD